MTEDTKVILMLCGVFGRETPEKPLSVSEYTRLVRWLIGRKMRPSDLLKSEVLKDASSETRLPKQRMEGLLARGAQLGFAVEDWQSKNIWVMSRSDHEYPTRFKKKLGDQAPPLLFGSGERTLLQGGGLAIVGSRNADENGEAFAREVARMCSYNRMPVVSGGARGIDRVSMSAALEAGGVTIGVLCDNLFKLSLEKQARIAIGEGSLLLISPYNPETGFNVGMAMGRNKLIYAMADFALVVSSDYEKGGTWAGAVEELKRERRIPVFVRVSNNPPEGNARLVDLGAIPWPIEIDRSDFKQHLSAAASLREEESSLIERIPETQPQAKKSKKPTTLPLPLIPTDQRTETEKEGRANCEPSSDESFPGASIPVAQETPLQETPLTIYQAVLPVILSSLEFPVSLDDLARKLEVSKTQLSKWLKKAVDEGKILKLGRPLKYRRKE